MDRLTFLDNFNEPCYRSGEVVYKNEISRRLAVYEDTGLTPEEIIKLQDKVKATSHLMIFEVEERLGPYLTPKVVIYNKNKISSDEALKVVCADDYNENVLCLDKKQFIALFRDGKE